MVNADDLTTGVIPSASFPAILIGGPPDAGKSVLTYNLTRELRRRDIPHFVIRASTDGEGDWSMSDDFDSAVLEIREQNKGEWSNTFRTLVCYAIEHRQLPLIVDLGGMPQEEDTCIFNACTHSILLLRGDKSEAIKTWHHYTTKNKLEPVAELYSQLSERGVKPLPMKKEPILTGTIIDLLYEERMRSRMGEHVFGELFDRVVSIFSKYTREQIETSHCKIAPIQPVIHLEHELYKVAPDTDKWSADLLPQLLEKLPPHREMAAYGRAPNWVYTALAMQAYPQPFHQFDACLGWVQPQPLQVEASRQQSHMVKTLDERPSDTAERVIELGEKTIGDAYIVRVRLIYYYLDYRKADQLAFPEPLAGLGVIVSGKIPFWLFTSLARFYVDRDVPWIAVNYAFDSRPVVVYSRVASHPIGKTLPKLT